VSLSGARDRKLSQSALKRVLPPLADAYEKTGAMAEAAKIYEAYVKLPKVNNPDASFKQAFLREKSDKAKAIELYNDNIKKYPKDARNFTRLGILLTTDPKQAAIAVGMLEKAEKLVPNDTLVLRHLCDAYRARGRSTKELATAIKLVGLQPKNIGMNQRAGAILFKKKEYAKAVPYLEKVHAAEPKKSDNALMLAEAYMKTKKPAQAMQTYESIHKSQPDNVNILVSLIAASEAAGKKKEAAGYRESLAALDRKNIAKDSTDVKGRLRLADYLFSKGDIKGALPIYKELSVLKPKDRYVFSRLVDITLEKGKEKEALTYLKKFVTLDKKNARARKDLGNILYKQKKNDEALVEYRMALKLDSTQTGFLKNYGDIVIKKKLEDEALAVLPLAIKAKEADPGMYVTLGEIYKKRKQYASAIDVFRKASAKDPKNVGILVQLAECQALKKDVSGAAITYEQVVMLNPKAVDEFKALGDLQMKQKKLDEAMKSYRKYLEKKNDSKIARIVGMHLYAKKQYKEALAYLERVNDKKLKTAEYLLALGDAYYLTKNCQKVCNVYSQLWTPKASKKVLSKILRPLGECYQKIGNNDQAAEAYAAYVALPDVEDVQAAYLRAFLAEKKDPKKAEAFYLANTKTFPKDGRNFLRLGIMYSENKATLKQATVQLENAASLDPKDISILARLAKIWNSLKNSSKELEAYTKLLVLDPDNKEANVRAGKLLYDKKKYKEAVDCLKRAAKNNPDDMEIKLMLSEAYLKTGDRKNGVALLEKVNEVRKDNPELMIKLYTVYKEMGKNRDAEKIIKRLITKQNDNKYRLLYAEDLIAQKRYDEAKFVTEKIVKEEPMNLEGLMLSGKALGYLKKYEEAIEAFKMVSYVKEDYAPAFYERAEMYRRQKNFERAEYFFNKALAINPKLALAHLGIARIRKAQGKMDEYRKLVEKAKALDPKDPEIIGEDKYLKTSVAPAKKK
jgi:tetratricopeptide (TPR) repeat protein